MTTDDRQHQEAMADERLERWLAQSPWLPPDNEFIERVMARIEETAPTQASATRRDGPVTIQRAWLGNAFALAATFLLGLGVGWVFFDLGNPGVTAERHVAVEFTLDAPNASQVSVVGEFSDWSQSYRMRQREDGHWVARIPLAPGDYEYSFVIDGQRWVVDPNASTYRDDGLGGRNAVIQVPARAL